MIPITGAQPPDVPNLRKVKGVITPEGEALTLKTCEACEGEFLGNKFQTECAACRITKKKKPRARG
jgi:hypothetical protein